MSDEHLLPEKYYSVEEVAKRFGVHRLTVVNWIKKGKIRAVKMLRRWFIYGI